MKLTKIFQRLFDTSQQQYMIKYESWASDFMAVLMGQEFVEEFLKVKNILLITDRHPRSLLGISYALFLARTWQGAKLTILSEGVHDELITNECKELEIEIKESKIIQNPEISVVTELVKQHSIDLIVIPFHHDILDQIFTYVQLPVLVAKLPRKTVFSVESKKIK
ncbi:MAG: hypothetical protein ACFFCQ_10830 [Promethearchaeota archaeon]